MPGFRSLIPALALVLCACDKPASASNPPVVGTADAGGATVHGGGTAASGAPQGGSTASGGGSVAASPGGNPGGNPSAAPPHCQPALDEDPTGLFGFRLLLRLPVGVELMEQNPFYARSVGANQASSCGTPIYFTAIGYLRSAAPLTDVRKYVLQLRGLAQAPSFSGESNQGSQLTAIYEVPQSSTGAPPLRGWMLLRRDGSWVYWVLLEAHPSNFAALEATFKAVTSSVMIRSVKEG